MASSRRSATRFKATLNRPAQPKNAAWAFLVLPAAASAKDSRDMDAPEAAG